MKALTICQPYASLIVGWDGMPGEIRKRVENRTWYCRHRGSLLIHAGQSRKWLDTWHGPVPDELPYGAIIGMVCVVDCVLRLNGRFTAVALQEHPWLADHVHAEGPYCIVLENPRRFSTPIPYRGQFGLFDVPSSIVAAEMCT